MRANTVQPDYWPTQEWRTADLATMGMDPLKIGELEHMIAAQYRNINSVLVVRQGYIVYERYYNGCGPLDLQRVASVTKSFTSALVGIAIDKGYLHGVDQKVLDFFPELSPGLGEIQQRTITLRHLLTMTAPFAWPTRVGFEPLDRLRRQSDWVSYILRLLGKGGLAGQFQYCTAGAHLLSAILTRATGISMREFANQHLFSPVGMSAVPDQEMKSFSMEDVFGQQTAGWLKDPQGITTGGWGLAITPRDMARFGWLYLNQGWWDGQQIVSEQWVAESTAMNAHRYGYLWWLREVDGEMIYSALGSGGNVICCIPAKNMVVVIASDIIAKPRDRWLLLEKCILPAVQG